MKNLLVICFVFFCGALSAQHHGLLRLEITADEKSDEVVAYFFEGATDGFDSNFEAFKIQSKPSGWPTAWIPACNIPLQIAAYPPERLRFCEIPVQLSLGFTGEHTFSASEISSDFTDNIAIRLEDRETGQITDLRTDEYRVNLNSGGNYNRFYILISNGAPDITPTITWNGNSWSNGVEPSANDTVLVSADYNGSSDLTLHTLLLSSGINFENSGNITATGHILLNGGGLNITGTTTLNGSTTQEIGGNFNHIVVNNSTGITLVDSTNILGVLELAQGIVTTRSHLNLGSTQDHTGYIVKEGGSVCGNVSIERIARDNSGDLGIYSGIGHRFISSPVRGATVAGLEGFTPQLSGAFIYNTVGSATLSPSNYPNIFAYDESRITSTKPAFFHGWYAFESESDALAAGRGFAIEMEPQTKVKLSGELYSSTVKVDITKGSFDHSGWHLLGNPYASPISLKQFLEDNSSVIFGTAFLRYPTERYNGNWVSYVGSSGVSNPALVENDAIAPMQSFMVYKTDEGNGTVSFQESQQVNPANFNMLRGKARHKGLLRMRLRAQDQEGFDEATVYLHPKASKGFDQKYDAQMLEYGAGSSIFIEGNDRSLKISGLPDDASPQVVALGVWIFNAGMHEIQLSQLLDWPLDQSLYLEDRVLGETIPLQELSQYRFYGDKGLQSNRFFLHIGNPPIPKIVPGESPSFFSSKSEITVRQKNHQVATLAVFTISGQKVLQKEVRGSSRIATSLPQGIYIARLTGKEYLLRKRIWIGK